MLAIFKREFKSYFTGMTGFLFCAVLLLFMGIFVTYVHLLTGLASFEYSLQSALTVYLLVIPVLTMRSLTEDKKAKIDRLLYALPLQMYQIILGKYLAMLAVLALPVLVIGLYPLILSAFGAVNFAAAYGALFAFFLLGAALIALCMFLSSLADGQVMAAILGFGSLLFLYLAKTVAAMLPSTAVVSLVCFIILEILVAVIGYYLTQNIPVACAVGGVLVVPTAIAFAVKSSLFEGLFPSLLTKLALFDRFADFSNGLFDLSAIALYLSLAVIFVVFTVLAAEKKRWN